MGFWELFLLAIGVSMDAFAVSICKGLSTKKASVPNMAKCGVWFGGFQALMPLIGFLLASLFAGAIQAVDHWVAFVLLGLIGKSFTWQMFIAGALLNAVPGILVQLTLIPTIMVALNRTGLVLFQRKQPLENLAVR